MRHFLAKSEKWHFLHIFFSLPASSFPGWPPGVLRDTGRGCRRRNMQGEEGRESKNPGMGTQVDVRVWEGTLCDAISCSLGPHGEACAVGCQSSSDPLRIFFLEESLNSILCRQHPHSPPAGGICVYECVFIYVYMCVCTYMCVCIYMYFLKTLMKTFCDPLISPWCSFSP